MSAGLFEFVILPLEVAGIGVRLLFGQALRFEYDSAGNVSRVNLPFDPYSHGAREKDNIPSN